MRGHPLLLFVVTLALAVLPGCAVSAVWNHGEPELVEVVDRTDRHLVELLVGGAEDPFVPVVLSDDPNARWALRAQRGGDEVRALLGAPGLFVLRKATVDATRAYEAEEVVDDAAVLVLEGAFDGAMVASGVAEADLLPATRAILDRPRWNAYTESAEQQALPPLQRACIQRLIDLDFAHLLGRPNGSLQVVSWLFVDDAGRPRFDEPEATARPRELDAAPLSERLQQLASGVLLVRTVDAMAERAFWRVRADRVWLAGGCEPARDGFRHRSTWRLEPVAAAASGTPERLPATLFVRERRTQWLGPWEHRLGQRLLLTPLAVLADCTVLLPVNLFLAWLDGDDEEDQFPR